MPIPAIIASILRGLVVDAATDDPQAKSLINAGVNMVGNKNAPTPAVGSAPAVESAPSISHDIASVQSSPAQAMFEERRRNDYLDRIGSRMNRGMA